MPAAATVAGGQQHRTAGQPGAHRPAAAGAGEADRVRHEQGDPWEVGSRRSWLPPWLITTAPVASAAGVGLSRNAR
jgi:hypothetical protein